MTHQRNKQIALRTASTATCTGLSFGALGSSNPSTAIDSADPAKIAAQTTFFITNP